MTYDLYIGDRMFSSWSLRGWLMLEKFNLPHRTHLLGLYSGTLKQDLAHLAPARLVPVLRTPEGVVVGESLAMAETLAERHPDKPLWPRDAALRARARWLCTEMVASFSALRAECPMQLNHVNRGFHTSAAVQQDLDRIELLWESSWDMAGSRAKWLFGAYSLADVFFAPVAARIIGYNLGVSDQARDYCLRVISDSALIAWREAAQEISYDPFPYDTHAPITEWPIP